MKFLRVNSQQATASDSDVYPNWMWRCSRAYYIHITLYSLLVFEFTMYWRKIFITKCWMFWCMLPTTLVTDKTGMRAIHIFYILVSIQNNKWLECWLRIVRCKLNAEQWTHSIAGCLFICLFVWTTIWWFKDAHHTCW